MHRLHNIHLPLHILPKLHCLETQEIVHSTKTNIETHPLARELIDMITLMVQTTMLDISTMVTICKMEDATIETIKIVEAIGPQPER